MNLSPRAANQKRRSLFRVLPGGEPKASSVLSEKAETGRTISGEVREILPELPPKQIGRIHRLGLRTLEVLYGVAPGRGCAVTGERSRPLRVLRLVSSLTQGGVGKVCLQTVLALNPEAVETTVVVFGEKRRQIEGRRWPGDLRVLARPLKLAPSEGSIRFYRDVFGLSRLIEETAPDIVHLHEPQFVLAVQAAVGRAARRGRASRLVVHLHNDYRQRNRSMPESVLPQIKRALTRSELIACSETIESAAKAWIGVRADRIARIEDGADDSVLEGQGTDAAEELEEAAAGKVVIACMANLAPHKRVEDFIDAGARLAREGLPVFLLLLVYGKKDAAESVRRYFEARIDPAHGEMLYRVGQPHALFRRIDIGVSCSALEGLGLNILEYQAEGIPVVCTDLKPHLEMVDDGTTGLTYPVGEMERLVELLRRLIAEPELRKSLGEAGKRTALQRRWSDTAAATVRFYQQLINALP